MSKRRGGPSKRRDNDFNRNIREGHLEKQLFDPRSDNPIAFNKKHSQQQQQQQQQQPQPQPQQRQSQETRRLVVSGRRLWSAENSTVEASTPSQREVLEKTETTKRRVAPLVTTPREVSSEPKISTTPVSEEEAQKKKKLKTLIASLRSIETRLELLTEKSQALPCFQEDTELLHDHEYSSTKKTRLQQQQQQLVEQDVIDAETIWKEKTELHLDLGDAYIDILECDLEYAQKKGLESLCWKRAIYGLVDQFRKSLKKSNDIIHTLSHQVAKRHAKSELAAMLFEDGDSLEMDEDDVASHDGVPVVQEGGSGGMTFARVERPSAERGGNDSVEHELTLQKKLAQMTLTMFLYYLDLADAFYLKLTCFFKHVEDSDSDDSIEQYLAQWRRTRKYKWYSCIPLRGDLARYRWAYVPESKDQEIALTSWTKEEAFMEAWKRYCLGVWLMPAKGNLYFNLSLILPSQDYDLHKFYLSTRSLMVRRNGFVNARESMLALFEANRRWVKKNMLDFSSTNNNKYNKSNKRSKPPPPPSSITPNVTVPALMIRLHGMLFTKIGLDEFSQVKRLFFDTLFAKKTESQRMAERLAYPTPEEDGEDKKRANVAVASFSNAHLFWFETIVLCLSSLYSYDYASAKLTKLIATHSRHLFYPDQTNDSHAVEQYKDLLNHMSDNILFTYEIDLICQIAVELLQRYLNTNLPKPKVPAVPELPHIVFHYNESKPFIFEEQKRAPFTSDQEIEHKEDEDAWLVYMEVLLHWMVLNGVCIRLDNQPSLWELLVGHISHDIIFNRHQHLRSQEQGKISTAFWPLLIEFLNKLLSQLEGDNKYDMVNKHLMEDEVSFEDDGTHSKAELLFTKSVCDILGTAPDLPEEHHLRGLGWVDEIHGRFLKLEAISNTNPSAVTEVNDVVSRRKMKILEYGFTLVKHLDGILYYDPVEEIFAESKSIEEQLAALELASSSTSPPEQTTDLESEDESIPPSMGRIATIEEMDDDVLLSRQVELDDDDQDNDDDDIMTQLKKRREQLQAIVTTAEVEEQYGFRRLPGRIKEREARLNYLRECIIPGKTILVLDTNCFIGHIDHVRKLLQSQKWPVIVPLVVVTELDGLRTNPHRLGSVAQQGIELLEHMLSSKPKQSTSIRIQTSHNNFMNDISIRSEQFVFGETDRNLDDLILSVCLWWISQQPQKSSNDPTIPVCLVTGDRNLSVKARARDVEVVPVSAIIQLTPFT
ncbi:hypothetical protein BD560DRAFT_382241 [Blakeslea trispora]|nr:hypothetical protein BD560DRAFT_382241 [Blakeslea trispora]